MHVVKRTGLRARFLSIQPISRGESVYNFTYTRFDGEFWVDNRVKRQRCDRQEDFLRVGKDSTFPCLCAGWTRSAIRRVSAN